MKIKQFWIHKKKFLWAVLGGIFVVNTLAQHILHIWDGNAIWILLAFLLLSPLAAWALSHLYPTFKHAFQEMKTRQMLFILTALVLSILITWQVYRAPVSYQTLTLTPRVLQDEEVELLEIKSDGVILPLREKAIENGWIDFQGTLIATQTAQPVTLHFLAKANSTVNVLLNSSPDGGRLLLTFNSTRREIDLSRPIQRQRRIEIHNQYRSIPNWLFIPFLLISDAFTFFILLLSLLILQERGQQHFIQGSHEKFFSHRTNLIILTLLASLLHLFSALSVPLILADDSPSYLQGAVHLLEYGNLDGVSMMHGPGFAFLFAPVLYIFGRSPWGIKLLLHLLGVGSVLLSYRLGWQLSRKRSVAFSIGFLTMLLPDLYYYSNFIMSDLVNIFLVVLFASLLLDAIENSTFWRVLMALLVGSTAALFRSENVLMLAIGIFFLGIHPVWNLLLVIMHKSKQRSARDHFNSLGMLIVASTVAILPILWWSFHNLKVNRFFGLSNYGGNVLYDGWMYFSEASGLDIRNEESPAIREINYEISKYPIQITNSSGVATGGTIFPSLIQAGYTPEEAYDLLQQATLDSISTHLQLIPEIIRLKIRGAFKPDILHTFTFPLSGETMQPRNLDGVYFDTVSVSIRPLILVQRSLFDLFQRYFAHIYGVLAYVALVCMFFSLYRKPALKWVALVLIASTRIFLPNLISIGIWRYTLGGIIFLVVFFVTGAAILVYGIKDVLFKPGSQFVKET
jgi:hypothetical protein